MSSPSRRSSSSPSTASSAAFGVTGEAADLVLLFCRYLAITFIFAGGLYVSNAAFNNLNYPALSTLLNWGRATLGTVPFVLAGAWIAGSTGALAGFFIGGIPFGIVAMIFAYRIVSRLGREPVGRPGRGAPTSVEA